jgi:hypothetical protein
MYVSDQSRSSNGGYSNIGNAYINDTGIAGNEVFTRGHIFAVWENEAFEVIDNKPIGD